MDNGININDHESTTEQTASSNPHGDIHNNQTHSASTSMQTLSINSFSLMAAEEVDAYEGTPQTPDGGKSLQIRSLLAVPNFKPILLFIVVYGLAQPLSGIVLPGMGSKWFADCPKNDRNADGSKCKYDYDTYVFYESLFSTLRSVVALFVPMIVGHMSDFYGRKFFLSLQMALAVIPSVVILVYFDIIVYWCVDLLRGICGGGDGFAPVLLATMSDRIPINLKTLSFSIGWAFLTAGVLCGTVLAAGLSVAFSGIVVFVALACIYSFDFLYVLFAIEESLPMHRRKQNFDLKKYMRNPLKPAMYVNRNPIIFLTSMLNFVFALPLSLIGVVIVYANEQLNINDTTNSALVAAVILVTYSLSCICNGALIVPFLMKRNVSDVHLIMGSCVLLILSCFCFASVSWFNRMQDEKPSAENGNLPVVVALLVLSCVMYAFVVMGDAPTKAVATKYIRASEHGSVMGILDVWRSISAIVGPFGFALAYNGSKRIHMPELCFYGLAMVCLLAFFLALYPLRMEVNRLHLSGKIYALETEETGMKTAGAAGSVSLLRRTQDQTQTASIKNSSDKADDQQKTHQYSTFEKRQIVKK